MIVAFCAWLQSEGWSVEREVSFVDVLACHDGVTLYAEAKGRTTSPGLDVDTMYGQLLRRMTDSDPTPLCQHGVTHQSGAEWLNEGGETSPCNDSPEQHHAFERSCWSGERAR